MARSKQTLSPKIPLLITLEIIVGLFIGTASLFTFVILAGALDFLHTWDVITSEFIYTIRTPFLTSVMQGITYFGNEVLIFLLITLFVMMVLKKYGRQAIVFALIFCISVLANLLLKEIFSRPRPELSPLIQEVLYSFPSGHAMNSFVFYSMIVLYVYRFTRGLSTTVVTALVCALLVVLIGVSRVYLGVHYPSDIIAGYIAGLWWVVTALVIEKSLLLYRVLRAS